MKSVFVLIASVALLGAAGCATSGQQQAQPGELQLPGERPAKTALNLPPDEWASPGHPNATGPTETAFQN